MLEIHEMEVSGLIPYAGNARKHDDENIAQIASSISEYGFNDPIAINEKDNVIIEGHGRLLAAKKLGMQTVPVVKLGHLSPAQIKGYTLIHNRLAEKSEWDKDILGNEISKLQEMDFDIGIAGFDTEDIADMDLGDMDMGDVPAFQPASEGEQGKLDRVKIMICPHCKGEFENGEAETKIVD